MKNEITVFAPEIENNLSQIDAEKLPQVLNKQVQLLEKANTQLELAEIKEKQAHENVALALANADELINKAKKLGSNTPEKSKFLWWEWTSKTAEIDALKMNLKEIIEHNSDSAEAQKTLVNVQSALLESQTSILQVQKANMEYQRQIADATKFIFGLSAYNMGVSQSIYVNLKAILSNESPERMGELAQQQLFLALDQIKNQESLITRIKENENLIQKLNLDIVTKQKEIEEICTIDEEQNKRLTKTEHNINMIEKQDAEQDRLIDEGIEKDKAQDAQISENAQDIDNLEKQDAQQDILIAEDIEKNRVQDAQISINTQDIESLQQQITKQYKLIEDSIEKDKEQDKLISEIQNIDQKQDEQIALSHDKNKIQDEEIRDLIKENEEQHKKILILQEKIQQLQSELSTKGNKMLLIATSIASVGALIISILQFFI